MKGKKRNIKFLVKRYPLVIKDSSFKVTEPCQEKSHREYGETISLVIYSHWFYLTYLLSETEIPSHLTLQMLKNKVYKLIKIICLMANQSSRFNFYISNIERTTK